MTGCGPAIGISILVNSIIELVRTQMKDMNLNFIKR